VLRAEDLANVDLAGADLRKARFEEVTFTSCNLAGADLRGAEFILCTMNAVVLRGVVLGSNRFYGTTFVEPIGLTDESRRTIERGGGLFPETD
jgi:uncharacterized protein YjbI with pentapeptide repeats